MLIFTKKGRAWIGELTASLALNRMITELDDYSRRVLDQAPNGATLEIDDECKMTIVSPGN